MGIFGSLFGPSKKEIWSQIAYDIGGRFKDGGFWKRDYIRYEYGSWEIVLDTYTRSSGKSKKTYMACPKERKKDTIINKKRKRYVPIVTGRKHFCQKNCIILKENKNNLRINK